MIKALDYKFSCNQYKLYYDKRNENNTEFIMNDDE